MRRRLTVKKILILFLLFFVITFIFFTNIYLNSFKTPFKNIIASILDINKIEYDYIKGNLVNGFKLTNFTLYSDNYVCISKKIDIDISLIDIFNGFKKIDAIKLEDVELIIKGNYQSESKRSVKQIKLINFKASYNNENIFFKDFNITSDSKGQYRVQGKGNAHLLDCVFDIENLNIEFSDNYFKYLVELGSLESRGFNFAKMNLSGEGEEIRNFRGIVDIYGIKILEKNFSNIHGEIKYLESKFYIDVPVNSSGKKEDKEYTLDGRIAIQDSLVNIKKIDLRIKNEQPILIEDQSFFVNRNEWYGANIYLKYQNGGLLIENFKIKNLNNYAFNIRFDRFDIKLFKGLNASGYLSGDLHILSNDNDNSALFSNTKIEDFSYEGYSFDSVKMEGSFNNNELALSNLKISKQIGFLDVSGSFSSLDNFYNKIIHKLNLKIKL